MFETEKNQETKSAKKAEAFLNLSVEIVGEDGLVKHIPLHRNIGFLALSESAGKQARSFLKKAKEDPEYKFTLIGTVHFVDESDDSTYDFA